MCFQGASVTSHDTWDERTKSVRKEFLGDHQRFLILRLEELIEKNWPEADKLGRKMVSDHHGLREIRPKVSGIIKDGNLPQQLVANMLRSNTLREK